MIRHLQPDETLETSTFGGFCPYWTRLDGEVVIGDTAEEIIDAVPESDRILDPAALLGLFDLNFVPGTLTMVQGIHRMPWRASLDGRGSLRRRPPLPHGNAELAPDRIAHGLLDRLEVELLEVLKGRERIYLLLTGGLDSRVIAGVLRRVEKRISGSVECVTWGSRTSRDVAYASRIAGWFGWKFHHVDYGAEETWENLETGAIWGGSEVAGHHLHGMAWFERAAPDDIVLASSFGDSIGRAEFSGKHVLECRIPPLENRRGLIHPVLERGALARADQDRAQAWAGEEDPREWVRAELDRQENYMRRLICHAMDSIRRFCDLYQAFTAEEVVRYMWSFAPQCRTDQVYVEALRLLDDRLTGLPWARTGVAPDGTREPDPSLSILYHDYAGWFLEPLRRRLLDGAGADALPASGAVFGPAVDRLIEAWSRSSEDRPHKGQHVAQLCSLELTRRRFGLLPCRRPSLWRDRLAGAGTRLRNASSSGIRSLRSRW